MVSCFILTKEKTFESIDNCSSTFELKLGDIHNDEERSEETLECLEKIFPNVELITYYDYYDEYHGYNE